LLSLSDGIQTACIYVTIVVSDSLTASAKPFHNRRGDLMRLNSPGTDPRPSTGNDQVVRKKPGRTTFGDFQQQHGTRIRKGMQELKNLSSAITSGEQVSREDAERGLRISQDLDELLAEVEDTPFEKRISERLRHKDRAVTILESYLQALDQDSDGDTVDVKKSLLGHELTHVVQQRDGRSAPNPGSNVDVIAGELPALKKGDRVALVGFGSFSASQRAARTGRNPQTGATIKIAAKNVAKFKAGADLSNKVN
jgi:DNA-binding protein HU-beta